MSSGSVQTTVSSLRLEVNDSISKGISVRLWLEIAFHAPDRFDRERKNSQCFINVVKQHLREAERLHPHEQVELQLSCEQYPSLSVPKRRNGLRPVAY